MTDIESALEFARWLTGGVGPEGLVPNAVEHWAVAITKRDVVQREAGRQDVERGLTARGDDSPLYPRVPMFPRDEGTPAPNVVERIEQGAFEQPPSLVEQLNGRGATPNTILMVAEAIDALTAEARAQITTDDRIFRRLEALEARKVGLRGADTTPVSNPLNGGG